MTQKEDDRTWFQSLTGKRVSNATKTKITTDTMCFIDVKKLKALKKNKKITQSMYYTVTKNDSFNKLKTPYGYKVLRLEINFKNEYNF
jgi:hypothetical protein